MRSKIEWRSCIACSIIVLSTAEFLAAARSTCLSSASLATLPYFVPSNAKQTGCYRRYRCILTKVGTCPTRVSGSDGNACQRCQFYRRCNRTCKRRRHSVDTVPRSGRAAFGWARICYATFCGTWKTTNDTSPNCMWISLSHTPGADTFPGFSMVDEWLEDAEWNQLTLLGDVGSGKSFFCRMVALRLANAYVAEPLGNL
jgi:hypothetical protein